MNTSLLRLLKACLATSVWLLACNAQAQFVSNGNFENFSCGDPNPQIFPFQGGCVPAWGASHGSPQIKRAAITSRSSTVATTHAEPTVANNIGYNNYVYMWAQSGLGEGVLTQVNLRANRQYELSFRLRGFNGVRLAAKVATNLSASGNTTNSGAAIPNGINVVWQQGFSPGNTWTQYTTQFTVPYDGNFQLWFYPETATNGQKHEVHLDDVVIEDLNCLIRNVYYSNTSALPATTNTQGMIYASSNASSTIGPVQVLAGQNVFFGAGTEVVLYGEFSVEQGATFRASPVDQDCTPQRPAGLTWWNNLPRASSGEALDSVGTEARRVEVYPNPVTNLLTVTTQGVGRTAESQAIIYNSYGTEVKRFTLQPGPTKVDVRDLPPGIYYLHSKSESGVGKTRFQVKR